MTRPYGTAPLADGRMAYERNADSSHTLAAGIPAHCGVCGAVASPPRKRRDADIRWPSLSAPCSGLSR